MVNVECVWCDMLSGFLQRWSVWCDEEPPADDTAEM